MNRIRLVFIVIMAISIADQLCAQDKINQNWINTINPAFKSGDSFDITSFTKPQDSNNDHDQIQEKFDAVIQLIDSGMYDQALSKTNLLLSVLPNHGFTHYLRGMCYRGASKYDSAVFEFRKVFKTKDFELFGEVRIQIGQIEMDLENFDRARDEFEIAENVLPRSPAPKYLIGMTYLYENKVPRARKYFDSALEVDSAFYQAYLMKTIIHLSNYRLTAASKVISQLIESDSTYYEAYLMRGILCSAGKKAEKCMSDFVYAITLDPSEPAAYSLLGYSQIMAGEYKDGIKNIAKNIELREPQILKARYVGITFKMLFDWAVIQFNNQIDNMSSKTVESISKGILNFENGNISEAKNQFQEALKQNSNNGVARLFIGIIYDRFSSISDKIALAEYYLALESLGESTELLYRIAYLNAGFRNFDIAAEYMKKVVALNKDNYKCVKELGDYYFKSDDLQKAYSMYSIYLHFNQLNKSVLLNRALCFYAFSSIDDAIKDLEAARGIDSLDYDISSTLTTMYMFSGDTLGALAYSNKILKDYKFRINEVKAAQDKGDERSNTNKLSNALNKLNKEIMLSYNVQAVILSEMGELQKAIEAYDEGLIYYYNLEAKVSKGVLLYRLNSFENAITIFNEVIDNDARETNSLYYKGLCLIALNRDVEGNQLIKKASDLGYQLAREYQSNQ